MRILISVTFLILIALSLYVFTHMGNPEFCLKRYGHHPCDSNKPDFGYFVEADYRCFERVSTEYLKEEKVLYSRYKLRYRDDSAVVEIKDGSLFCPTPRKE